MFDAMNETLVQWNKTTSERAKLQHTYIVAALLTLIAAGLIGLINDTLSNYLLQLTFLMAVVFFVNAVAWALLQSFVLGRIKASKPRKR